MSTPLLGNLITSDRLVIAGQRFKRDGDGGFIDGDGNPFVDLSRFRSDPLSHLGSLSFKCQGAFPSEG